MKQTVIVFLIVLALGGACVAQASAEWRSWNQPVEPFRIAGNLYYVGANEITSYLVTSPSGHILIDGGFAETAPQIERNIEKLGFKVTDIRILLNSHSHADHAGGLAELKRRTGAKLLISEADAIQIERGGHSDPAFGDKYLFPAATVDGRLKDGEHVRVGNIDLTAHITPGHTKGCTTWTTTVEENGKKYEAAVLCSVSSPDYKLVGNQQYPNIVEDFQSTFRRLEAMHPDIFLGAHGGMFHLEEKRAAMGAGKPNPFVVPGEWERFLQKAQRDFEAKLKQQRSAAK